MATMPDKAAVQLCGRQNICRVGSTSDRMVHHLAMNTATGDVCAVEFTSSDKGDSPVLPQLLAQIASASAVSFLWRLTKGLT